MKHQSQVQQSRPGISNRELASYMAAFVVTFVVVFIGLVWIVYE